MTEDIGVLSHEETCFDVFLLVAVWLNLVLLHQSKNNNIIHQCYIFALHLLITDQYRQKTYNFFATKVFHCIKEENNDRV